MTDQPGPNDPLQPDSSGQPTPPPPPPPAPPPAPAAPTTPPPPPAYGTPPPAPGYSTPAPAPGYGQMPAPGYQPPVDNLPYANWGKRVLSGLIDYIGPGLVAWLLFLAVRPLGVILYLAALAWTVYNLVIQGQTGQSTGKRIAGTKLVLAATGQPVGVGLSIGRAFVHIIDGIPCYIGYLWPLWDSKRQTFADKILNTYVLDA